MRALLALLLLALPARATDVYLGRLILANSGDAISAPNCSSVTVGSVAPAPSSTYRIELRSVTHNQVYASCHTNLATSNATVSYRSDFVHSMRHQIGQAAVPYEPTGNTVLSGYVLTPFQNTGLCQPQTDSVLVDADYGYSTDTYVFDVAEWMTFNANGRHVIEYVPTFPSQWTSGPPGHLMHFEDACSFTISAYVYAITP